jgi:hypothetical protein
MFKWPASPQDEMALVRGMWQYAKEDETMDQAMFPDATYLSYVKDQCSHAFHEKDHIALKTRGDLVEIVQHIIRGLPREKMIEQLGLKYPEPESNEEIDINWKAQLENAVDLAARLVSMIDIGPRCCRLTDVPARLLWEHGPLKDFMQSHFSTPSTALDHNVRLERLFNGRNLERLARIRIEWTSNLDDHLRLTTDDDRKVLIFHHVSFLSNNEA